MTNIKELEKVRPCGRLETYSTARHHLGLYNNVGLTAIYTAPASSSNSIEAIVYAALKPVIAKHPVLSVIALNEDKSHPDVYFARLPSYDLRTCVEFHRRKNPLPSDGEPDTELDSHLTAQHNLDFKSDLGTKPFWRLIILTSPTTSTFTASWIFHHALSDGSSAMLFHQSFLAALNTLPSSLDPSPIVSSPPTPLPPAFEDQHPLPISWLFFLSTLGKILLPSLFARRPAGLWTSTPITSPLVPPKFKFRTLVFTAGISMRLTRLARANNTSMTALLQCTLSRALFTILPPEKCEKLIFTAPISMRRFLLDVPADQMVIAVGQLSYTHHRSSSSTSFDWDETRKVKNAIGLELAKNGADNPITLLKYVKDIHGYFKEKGGSEREGSVEVSNIGRWVGGGGDVEEAGKWRVGRLTFSQCANPVGAAICVNVITGGSGELTLGFAWGEGVVSEDLVGEVMTAVKGLVEGLVEEEERAE